MATALGGNRDVGFINYFNSMPKKPSTTVRLFERNDYYTAHGEDAMFVAMEIHHTTSVVKYYGSGSNKLPSVSLNKMSFESFIRDLLLVKRYRLEIYRNNSKFKQGNDWIVAYKASPGNLHQLEDVIFTANSTGDSCIVIAIRLATVNGQRVVGVAFVDSSNYKLGVCQFTDNDNFSNIETLLVQLEPKECIIPANDVSSDANILRKTILRTNILITERKKAEFNEKDIVQDLNRLLKGSNNSATLPELDLHQSMQALAAAIKYLELLSTDRNFNSFEMSLYDIHQYMKLDVGAAKALNVEACPGDSRTAYLQGVLNQCRTPQGRRLLNQWIKQPLINLQHIVERQDVVEALVDNVTLRHSIREKVFKIFPDLLRYTKKLQQKKATLQDCYRIYQALQLVPVLNEGLSGYQGDYETLLDELFTTPLKERESDFVKYLELIESTLDADMIRHHEYLIKPSFDDELLRLRNAMNDVEEKISAIYRKTASELSLEVGKTLKLESNHQIGYYMRLTKKMEKCIRGQKRYVILEARNDGVKFVVGSLRSLNEEYNELRRQYNQLQERFADEVIAIASGYSDPLISLNGIIARLDALASLAEAATMAPVPYIRPVMCDRGKGDIILEGARHPCLELQENITFIANDVSLLRGKDEFQIITGPNMGGKSTYIRMIGTIVLMAQIGSFVPCSSATISIVDAVLARLGAGDSQIKGVSTFMSEMLEVATILKTAGKDSLIIIDELGRGTSTYDGFGLAWAISKYICDAIGCFCLFATHFHELTSLADSIATVSNRHVTAISTQGSLTLLYRVQKGVSDQSFGIQVAEMAHFPSDVIEFSRQTAAELEVFRRLGNTRDDGGMDEATAKRKRVDIKEGEAVIDDCLRKLNHILTTDAACDTDKEIEILRNEMLSVDNSYIRAIIDNS